MRFVIILTLLTTSLHGRASDLCQNLFAYRDNYPWLEMRKGARRNEFRREQNQRTFADLKNKAVSYKSVQVLVRSIMDKPNISSSIQLAGNRKIIVQDLGLSKPKQVILVKPNGISDVLFDSFDWKRNGTFNFVDLSVSPDERYVTATAAGNGTIDDFNLVIFDLVTHKIIHDSTKAKPNQAVNPIHATTVAWLNPNRFVVSTESETSSRAYKIETDDKGKTKILDDGLAPMLVGAESHVTVLRDKTTTYLYQRGFGEIQLPFTDIESVIDADKDAIYLLKTGKHKWKQVVRVNRDGTFSVDFLTDEVRGSVTDSAIKFDDMLAIYRYNGTRRRVDLFDLKTKQVTHSFHLPIGLSISSIKWAVPQEKLTIGFLGPVVKSGTFTYDLKKKSYDEGDPEVAMTTQDGVKYEIEYFNIPSERDARLIPVRMIRKQGLAQDGTAAAFVEDYGGFASNGYMYRNFSAMNFEFLKRGGVLLEPGIRGGFERGNPWHREGMLHNKINVPEDLNSVLENLQRQGYFAAKKTISTGWSNGGMVSAAAAFLRPDLYALIVPGAGVQDYLNSYRKRMDGRYNGWIEELGDPRNHTDRSYMTDVAPVELAKNPNNYGPEFLIVVGDKDSRVNPADSLKLAYAASMHAPDPDKIHLISLNNAGHWMTSQKYQDTIAWASTSIIWTYVFSTAGMTIP